MPQSTTMWAGQATNNTSRICANTYDILWAISASASVARLSHPDSRRNAPFSPLCKKPREGQARSAQRLNASCQPPGGKATEQVYLKARP